MVLLQQSIESIETIDSFQPYAVIEYTIHNTSTESHVVTYDNNIGIFIDESITYIHNTKEPVSIQQYVLPGDAACNIMKYMPPIYSVQPIDNTDLCDIDPYVNNAGTFYLPYGTESNYEWQGYLNLNGNILLNTHCKLHGTSYNYIYTNLVNILCTLVAA